MHTLTVETVGAEHVLTLDSLKLHLRQSTDAHDDLLWRELVPAAEDWCAEYIRAPVRQQVYKQTQDTLRYYHGAQKIMLAGRVTAIGSVKYRDSSDGTLQTQASASYTFHAGEFGAVLELVPGGSWGDAGQYPDAWQIIHTAGWTAATVPRSVRLAVMLKVEADYLKTDGAERSAMSLLDSRRMPPW